MWLVHRRRTVGWVGNISILAQCLRPILIPSPQSPVPSPQYRRGYCEYLSPATVSAAALATGSHCARLPVTQPVALHCLSLPQYGPPGLPPEVLSSPAWPLAFGVWVELRRPTSLHPQLT